MPRHVYTIVALGHSVDAQTNNITLFGILDGISASTFPARVHQLSVVTTWRREPGDEGIGFVSGVRAKGPDGNCVVGMESEFKFDKPIHRLFGTVAPFPFPIPGRYEFEVQFRRQDSTEWSGVVASYPFDVEEVDVHSGLVQG